MTKLGWCHFLALFMRVNVFNALSMLKLFHLLIGAPDGDSYGMSETDKTSQPRA
ncbi:hypothetical protein [uncultured Psychrobacillus sp.]|uniref:hypothetical protein n=1 Tax=uncultured Psychrobacillus sp. TaxID=1551585 RepID=UPI002614443F|nr:hypothetical protein [uncultured Psychrobacillus sp.]